MKTRESGDKSPHSKVIGQLQNALVWASAVCFLAQVTAAQSDNSKGEPSNAFARDIAPLLNQYCVGCHSGEQPEANIRLDQLDSSFGDRQLFVWSDVIEQLERETMPPAMEDQPTRAQRRELVSAIRSEMQSALARPPILNGLARRLTVAQYRNTLRDLLGIEENVADVLPPDGISKAGFANNVDVLGLTPLQLEYYFEIADRALELCIVDPEQQPVIQNFRVDLGTGINMTAFSEALVLGANSRLLDNDDFTVTELEPIKSFAYKPFRMRTAYRFNEGYKGNDTVRGWREYDSIYHSVFACMRGSDSYPHGAPYAMVEAGLLLRPSPATSLRWQEASTYGTNPNFKIALRELPSRGNFRVRVQAARYAGSVPTDNQPSAEPTAGADAPEKPKPDLSVAQRTPLLNVYMGLRRDCGHTLVPVGSPVPVPNEELKTYEFSGALENFPRPHVDPDNDNYLAGISEIGVRSESTDGRPMPWLLVRSVEFEGPYYESWPPPRHRAIFIDSEQTSNSRQYAREVIERFMTRAYRRPVTSEEVQLVMQVWQSSFEENHNFYQSIKDALLVVLTSPQFLFLIERSETPEPEPLAPYELAAKLSYFLWNTAPDQPLLESAANNTLSQSLSNEVERLLADPRARQFIEQFTSQWLSIDKLAITETDSKLYPRLNDLVKEQLRHEPLRFIEHLIKHNLPLRNIVASDFVLTNESLATYYGLAQPVECGFEFTAVKHNSTHLGGLLTQAGVLASLSDGRESNPVKRGAWFARKIIADPPDDPPPNVPELKEALNSKLTLRERLEMHRDQPGCIRCHAGLDPWGLPFEDYDAGGLLKLTPVDSSSRLPTGHSVAGMNEFRAVLLNEEFERVAQSFMKLLAAYATGRDLSFREIEELKAASRTLKAADYPVRDCIQLIVNSHLFLKK